jgi:hypothetical protein
MVVGIILGIVGAALIGWAAYWLWNKRRNAEIHANIRAEIDRVRAGGATDATSFAPSAIRGARATIPRPS